MKIRNIPEDINVELLLSYFPEGSCKVALKGLHKRNSYKDIVEIEEKNDGSLLLGIGRNSLYNVLPEYMFHPVDRFNEIAKQDEKEWFAEEYRQQEQEKENAYKFFAPIDLFLLRIRIMVKERLNKLTEDNVILTDILCEQITDNQKKNRFIRPALKFIPVCKNIRGDKTLLTLMLRKIFIEEGIKIEEDKEIVTYTDERPRYADGLDATMDDCYVGNIFEELTTVYNIHYWSEDDCDEKFIEFVKEIESFQGFINDYFISVEERLCFCIYKNAAPLRLSDEMVFNYLNYNTNL